MQTFLLSRRSTASGNGIGSAPTTARYKTSASGEEPLRPRLLGRPVATLEDGALAVRLAREAVGRALGDPAAREARKALPSTFRERRGVFVTWYEHPAHRLRGCIGYPHAVLPLGEAVREAAVSAALEDPRFAPVTAGELRELVAEVSLLTPFEPISPRDRPGGVAVGRDGLVVESGARRGLLLPQVAPEQGWDREQLLDGTCEKAGLARGAWRSPQVNVYRFQAEIFRERSPGGEVVRAPGPG